MLHCQPMGTSLVKHVRQSWLQSWKFVFCQVFVRYLVSQCLLPLGSCATKPTCKLLLHVMAKRAGNFSHHTSTRYSFLSIKVTHHRWSLICYTLTRQRMALQPAESRVGELSNFRSQEEVLKSYIAVQSKPVIQKRFCPPKCLGKSLVLILVARDTTRSHLVEPRIAQSQ